MSSAQNSDILLNFVYNLKNVENSRGGVLLLQLQALTAKNFFVHFRLVLSSVALVKKTKEDFSRLATSNHMQKPVCLQAPVDKKRKS